MLFSTVVTGLVLVTNAPFVVVVVVVVVDLKNTREEVHAAALFGFRCQRYIFKT